jgi:hypothetical protein
VDGILDIVHSDVCVPMPSTSLRGYVYHVTFIDDYSRKTWVYFLNLKDEVFEKFKEFKDLVENLSEKILRYSGKTMEESTLPNDSNNFVDMSKLRGNSPLPITHNKMV